MKHTITTLKGKFEQSPLAKRLIMGGVWSLSGNIASKGILLLTTILVAQVLGKNDYGQYSLIRTTIFMFIAFASVGVGATATKYIAQYREKDIQRAYNIYIISSIFSLIFGVITSITLILLSKEIATSQLDAPDLSRAIVWGAILLFFCTINGAQAGALSGFENFKEIARNSFFSSIIELIAILLLAYYYGVIGAIIGSGIGYIVLTITNHISIRRNFINKVIFRWELLSRNDLRTIFVFGIPSALSTLAVIFALWYIKTLLAKNSGFDQVADFNAADQIKSFILFIPAALAQIILPIITNLKENSSKKNYLKVLYVNIIINITISAFLAIIIIAFSSQIISLYGSEFRESSTLILLALSTIFSSFATVVGLGIASQGKMWAGFFFNLIWCAMVISFSTIFLIKGYGAIGLALSILIAYIIHSLYQFIYLRYFLVK